ncbi:IS66 C-terminal element [Garciella nitratireducens DSM 15102]|uniref:IS66 C-terminal element n=1 Tax=Garciella nitratireducens DSM 15102 TaxID=1121911 RepID=A0A1T4N6C5_9FIRM|nr:IS66 C-terminal element [Garciella nitratireducens DSM 15102]
MHRKYSEAIPLYRQEKEYQNFGINLSRQNLANWIMYGANTWLKHLYNRMHGYLLKELILHADETTMQVLNEEGKKPTSKSYMWLEYRKEKLTPEEIYKKRLEKTKPVLQNFLLWLKTKEKQVLPKSNLGKSINYCLNQWDKLIAFMLDGRIEISNNRAERAIKPFIIGRKNFLFSKSPKGAQASAITYSIIETAKANNLNPFYYLTYLFEKLPNIDLDDMEELDQLLLGQNQYPKTVKFLTKNSIQYGPYF